MTTLITDGFDEGEHGQSMIEPYEPHNILYGSSGWTDALDDDTLALLVEIGAVRLLQTHSGLDWETRIYVSKKGREPE